MDKHEIDAPIIKLPHWTMWFAEILEKLGLLDDMEVVYECRLCGMDVAEGATKRHLRFHHPEVLE